MNVKCKNVVYKDLQSVVSICWMLSTIPAAGRWDAEVLGNIFKELGVR